MKALTIRQPWASLIAHGVKTIETRSWKTSYRGPIAIHAGAKRPAPGDQLGPWMVDWGLHPDHSGITNGGFDEGCGFVLVERPDGKPSAGEDCTEYLPLHLGAVVATATLTDCVPVNEHPARPMQPNVYVVGSTLTVRRSADQVWPEDIEAQRPLGDFTPGRWAWLLADIKPTTERCPYCWGAGGFQEDSMILYGVPGGSGWSDPCPVCNPGGRRTEPLGVCAYGCDPVPAKGKQGLWNWEPS